MNKQRPTAVLVIAILNFVFGGLGIVTSLCAGGGLLALTALMSNLPNDRGGRIIKESIEIFNREAPLYAPFLISSVILGLITATILVICGVGLLKMKSWGRGLTIFYALLAIVLVLGQGVFSMAVLIPQTERAGKAIKENTQRIVAEKGGRNIKIQQNPTDSFMVTNLSTTIQIILGMAYPIVLLIIMFLPDVAAAFRNGGMSGGPPPDDRYGDYPQDRYYDDGYN